MGDSVSGAILVRPPVRGVKQAPPLPVTVELAKGAAPDSDLAGRIRQRLRDELIVTTEITLVPFGTLPRTDYKSKLVEWPES
jgi:phenylacetate-CoA ligase